MDNPKPNKGRTSEKPKCVHLKVTAELLGENKPKAISAVEAYAFSAGGKFLARNDLDDKGRTTLSIQSSEEASAKSIRLLIGPKVPDEELQINDLLRRGAEQQLLRIDPDVNEKFVAVPIIPNKLLCWLASACTVQGRVLKKVTSGGVPIDFPVCHATVEIYEVDIVPFLIRLPDLLIERFREIIIDPPPPPPPPFDPVEEFPQPESSPVPFAQATIQPLTNVLNTASVDNVRRATDASAPVSDSALGDLKFKAKSYSTEQFRTALIQNATLIKPLLCYFPLGQVKMDLVATTKTDGCGKFKTLFFKGCNNTDVPDLYFKVKQKVVPFLAPFTIYAPTPVPCFTYWNYKCGQQDVTLYVKNPFAITCPPCPPVVAPNNWVLFMGIGNLPASRIHGASVPQIGTSTTQNIGLTDWNAPFGKTLRPRIEFDNSLRDDLGVRYYRVSYRKGTTGDFIPMTGSINRHYTHEVGGDLVLESYDLGPKVVNSVPNLFEIPPALPPVGQWSIPDAVEDTTSAKFPTLNLAPLANPGDAWLEQGKYQIKVDLFDTNGVLVNIDTLGIKYRVPAITDLSGTIPTEDASNPSLLGGGTDPGSGLVRDDDGDGKKSFIMTLHIDNSRCKATIPAPSLNGSLASDQCGVMNYPPAGPASVALNYEPEYATGLAGNAFATYQFNVLRGANSLTLPPGDPTPTIPDSGSVPLPNAVLSDTQTVVDLLGPCTIAGFSENLHVWAKATTGWSRISAYDAHATRAFVLAPQTPPVPTP